MSQVFINTTIANLRAMSGSISEYFYTTDLGQEGNWYYDPTDTTSADNLGTILVTADGKRFKRPFFSSIQASWFDTNYSALMIYVNANINITSLNFDKDIVDSFTLPVIDISRDNLTLNFNNKLLSNIIDSGNGLIRIRGNNIEINDCNLSAEDYTERVPLIQIYSGNDIKINRGIIKDTAKAIELSAKTIEEFPSAANISNVEINGLKITNVIDGVYIGEAGEDLIRGTITNVLITNCNFYGGKGTDEETGGDGIKTTRKCSNIRILGNNIDNFKRDAIDLFASGNKIIVSNNFLVNSGIKGIDIKSNIVEYTEADWGNNGIDINITSNQILYNLEGISIDRLLLVELSYNKQISISNNNISYNKDVGIFLCGQYVSINNNFFVGNGYDTTKVDDYTVIRLGNDQTVRIAKNVNLSNNTFINNGKTDSDNNYAIRVARYSVDNTITNNEIYNEPDLPNDVQTCGIYINQDSSSLISFNKISVIDAPYVIVSGAIIESNKKADATVSPLIDGDTFVYKAITDAFIGSAVITSTEDLSSNATDNIVMTLTRVRGGIETTLGFYNQGTTGLAKYTDFKLSVDPSDSIVLKGDIHLSRVFRNGSPTATRPLNITVSYL